MDEPTGDNSVFETLRKYTDLLIFHLSDVYKLGIFGFLVLGKTGSGIYIGNMVGRQGSIMGRFSVQGGINASLEKLI